MENNFFFVKAKTLYYQNYFFINWEKFEKKMLKYI